VWPLQLLHLPSFLIFRFASSYWGVGIRKRWPLKSWKIQKVQGFVPCLPGKQSLTACPSVQSHCLQDSGPAGASPIPYNFSKVH
jgi:hypothetical protein